MKRRASSSIQATYSKVIRGLARRKTCHRRIEGVKVHLEASLAQVQVNYAWIVSRLLHAFQVNVNLKENTYAAATNN